MNLVSSDLCPPRLVDILKSVTDESLRHKTGACTRIQRSIGLSMGYRTDFAEKDLVRNLALGLISKDLRPFERVTSYSMTADVS